MTTGTMEATNKRIGCKVHYRQIAAAANLPALNQVFSQLKNPSILGGNDAKKDGDGFSYWAAEPKEVFEFKLGQKEPFVKLQNLLEKYYLCSEADSELPDGIFLGGWVGYFGYELGRFIEKLPETATDDIGLPLIRLCFYDKILCYDHENKEFLLIALELGSDAESPKDKLAALENLLNQSLGISVRPSEPCDMENIDFASICCNMDKGYYLEAFEKIKKYIYDGVVYQINFSQRFDCDFDGQAIALFRWQNQYNASPYSAYIDGGDFQIVSASPEMYIAIRDGVIRTRPIKGTRPRTNSETENDDNLRELLGSEKEKAELNMIIDLERNDVARICRAGTRRVSQPRAIEIYPTVFHAVATVEGQLRGDVDFCDVLRAMFPGGSITGAPKVSSMEIIDELEPTARSVYTGSIGFIGIDGSVCLNIAIRTIIIKDKKAYAQTGGGIVADSQAQAEWQETLTKAKALIAGINSVQDFSG